MENQKWCTRMQQKTKTSYCLHVLVPCALTMNVIQYLVFGVCFYLGLNFVIMDLAQ